MNARRAVGVALLAASVAGIAWAAEPSPAQKAAAARVHAQDIADLFREACLLQKADPDEVADWALNHGFVVGTKSGGEVAAALKQRGESGNVFSRSNKDESVLLIATANPSNCLVMGLSPVDGPRLRGRMEAMTGEWSGVTVTAEPANSMDYDEDGPHRKISYVGESGPDRYRLMVVSPVGTARGSAILGVSVEPRR